MRCGLFFFLVLMALAGCAYQGSPVQAARYHIDGRSKPTVALVPVINKTDTSLPWSLSQELTSGLEQRFNNRGDVFLTQMETGFPLFAQLQHHDLVSLNPKDLESLKNQHQFIVLAELIEHREVPYHRQQIKPIYPADGEIYSVLMMKVRVNVYDLRESEPKIILQEILLSNHMMPKEHAFVDYQKMAWGTDPFISTPIGRAHARLARDLSNQIHSYILAARN